MSQPSHQYLLGLGSNLGDKALYIEQAIQGLEKLPKAQILAISEGFDSDPVGYQAQDNFLNLCLSVSCDLRPEEMLSSCLEIERQLGRVRTVKDGPRTVDLDLLFWSGGNWQTADLTLPHPRWAERTFVTLPLRQLLHAPALAKDPTWAWLRSKVGTLPVDGSGLRPWQGPTPWKKPTR